MWVQGEGAGVSDAIRWPQNEHKKKGRVVSVRQGGDGGGKALSDSPAREKRLRDATAAVQKGKKKRYCHRGVGQLGEKYSTRGPGRKGGCLVRPLRRSTSDEELLTDLKATWEGELKRAVSSYCNNFPQR